MRYPTNLIRCLIIFCAGTTAQAQGTFQNLGFESATLVPVSADMVQFSPAFPGWTGTIAGSLSGVALYNNWALDISAFSIMDRGWSQSQFPSGVIQGNYSAILQAGLRGPSSPPADVTLSQTGFVPATAQSLQFKGSLLANSPNMLVVTLGGQRLSLTTLGSGTNYTLYGADVHGLAGQTAELDFTLRAETIHNGNQYFLLDAIQFSTQAIPEPGVFALCALGALLLGWRAMGRKR